MAINIDKPASDFLAQFGGRLALALLAALGIGILLGAVLV